jgi:hypothetical protein
MRGIYARSGVYARLAYARLCSFLCEFPWWLYICSQLGFTSSFSCLLLQVEVLGLAGFMYPSSGLLPWQEPGRQISRTEGSYPRQRPSPRTCSTRSMTRKAPRVSSISSGLCSPHSGIMMIKDLGSGEEDVR